jgi:hypothetical protein
MASLDGAQALPHSAGVSIERLRGGLLWLTGLAGAFVFIEPSPYEYVSLLTMFVFGTTGMTVRRGAIPLLLLLVLYVIGFAISVIQILDQQKAVTWVLISCYLASTALFFSVALADQTQRYLSLLLRGTMLAAIVASLAAIVGYLRINPELSALFLRFDRARGTFNDPNVLGAFLVLPILIALQRTLGGRTREALSGLLMLSLFTIALFLSFSRGAWAQCAAAALVVTILTFLTTRSATQRLRLVIMAVCGGGVLAALVTALLSIDSVAALFSERATFEQTYDLGRFGRFGRHGLGFLLALDRPFGIGPLQFHLFFVEDPHNAFLNAFMSGGWLSGLSYATLMLVTVGLGLRHAFVRTPWQPTYIAIYAAFVGVFGETFIIDSDHWRHFFLLIGLIWGLMMAGNAHRRPDTLRPADASAPAGCALGPCTAGVGSVEDGPPERRSVAQPG